VIIIRVQTIIYYRLNYIQYTHHLFRYREKIVSPNYFTIILQLTIKLKAIFFNKLFSIISLLIKEQLQGITIVVIKNLRFR